MKFKEQHKFKDKKGIYGIVNNINNFVYIGQTRQRFNKRYWHHHWKLRGNSHDNIHLQNAWNLYGESNFTFFIVECVENNEELNVLEEKYIGEYRVLECCYNIQDGGQVYSYYTRTDEHRKSIGEKNRQHMLGRKHSNETKKKMSESHKGRHYNEENYKITEKQAFTIKKLLVDGVEAPIVAEELGISYKIINGILSNNSWSRVHVDGWDEFRNSRERKSRLTNDECLEIYKLYETGNYTQQELGIIYNKTRHSISNAIKRAKRL